MRVKNPIICFGQQPNGIFPRRFFVAKIATARRIQKDIGGTIVLFYHDSDHDIRETVTIMRDRQSGALVRLNFFVKNKIQKKYSPMYYKEIREGWREYMSGQLPRFVSEQLQSFVLERKEERIADFCLSVYREMGLLDGITVVRSSGPLFREQANDLDDDYYADVPYEGEIVRARKQGGKLCLHRGGGKYIFVPSQEIKKKQKSAPADKRFSWMQSVVGATHYVFGRGEAAYLQRERFPSVEFVSRDSIDEQDMAWIESSIPF